jgi:hypothetical protein
MKINKKLPILLGVITLSYISTLGQFKPVQTQAALTEPTSYDYAYKYDSVYGGFLAFGDSTDASVHYTRTTDGAYYNYTYTGNGQNNWPFNVTMTFNRSNTTWTVSPYEPDDTKIGSDNTVGTVENKWYFRFQNNTPNHYLLSFDQSSKGAFGSIFHTINSVLIGVNSTVHFSSLTTYFIPSYTDVIIRVGSTSAVYYFDAWYLRDLGESDAYNAGFDAGEITGYDDGYAVGIGNNPNILLNGFQAMVGILVNFFLMIVNLEVFGVSISSVFAIIVIFVGIIWTLKIIRG